MDETPTPGSLSLGTSSLFRRRVGLVFSTDETGLGLVPVVSDRLQEAKNASKTGVRPPCHSYLGDGIGPSSFVEVFDSSGVPERVFLFLPVDTVLYTGCHK